MKGSLLVAGTTSDAGKSVVTAGLCRWLVREGFSVAPFKAQNMSNNSTVTVDGAEIGRAQAMQAAAARVEPEAAMNPVLLKPGSDRVSHVVVMGQPVAEVDAMGYREWKPKLLEVALSAYADLRERFDVVVCEGAGSPTEINLRATDIANMGLARATAMPVLVVGDIDRGGVFAALYGTLALMPAADQALVAGFVVNKFRGDRRLLQPGLDQLAALTGRPVLGVLPWLAGVRVDAEDSLGLDVDRGPGEPPIGEDVLRIAVVRLPRISNFTDIDALAAEPGVAVRMVTSAAEVADADLVVLPGTRTTVADLGWLRSRGLDVALARRAAAGLPVLGICGGYQMLGRSIVDGVESAVGTVAGLGLLPVDTVFGESKVLARPRGTALDGGGQVSAYEIHHGRIEVSGGQALFSSDAGPEGCRVGSVWGTVWHGVLENDGFRRRLLGEVAAAAGKRWLPGEAAFADVREAGLDALGDLVAENIDREAVLRLISAGAPAGLPFLAPGVPG
ncbi:MAG: adenosylcobyric acid synthase [Frankiales bacterium]|nr:adenosylcobyric acid synthase [Frankiales bacterium]